MKKIVSLLLCITMILACICTSAEAPDSSVLKSTNIVNVVGNLEDGSDYVNILLMDKSKNVMYINQFPVEEDGTYRAKFKYPGGIAGLELKVKQGDTDVTKSVVEAIAEEAALSYTLDVVNSPVNTEIKAEIKNYYNVPNKTYKIILAYYDGNNKLLSVDMQDTKNVGEDVTLFEEDFKYPEAVKKIKVFMWNNEKTMIPLVESIEGNKNETIRVLAIGNSYAVDAFEYLDEIAESEGVNLELRIAQQSGATFTKHWNTWTATTEEDRKKYTENGEKVDIAHFLEDGSRYDYITIQQSSAHSGDEENYLVNAENVVKYIRERQPTAEILIHKTWSNEKGSPVTAFVETYNSDRDYMTAQIDKCVENARVVLGKVKTDSGLEVSPGGKPLRYIPSGDAVTLARQSEMFDTTYTLKANWDDVNNYWAPETIDESTTISLHRDSYHMSRRFGRYLVGLVWYRVLTGNSVANNQYTNASYPISEEGREIINAAAQKAVDDTKLWDNY